ncbi:MAG: hypothetical protein HYV76_02060 [Candidatus Vogelbacteria bacterium]|nr:hypothetical protein [Candidatus Vogelbacteria bacterium]
MSKLDTIANKIIKEQELIIGPLAWEEAGKVSGVNITNGVVEIKNGDEREVVNKLVGQYEHLFGRASREVCREAVTSLLADLSPAEIPSSLR